MRKRLLVCLTAVLCALGLSGCIFGDVDEMYALPKSSEAYVNLQARINQEKGSAESIAPLSGENRQAIQLVDVDRDGEQQPPPGGGRDLLRRKLRDREFRQRRGQQALQPRAAADPYQRQRLHQYSNASNAA